MVDKYRKPIVMQPPLHDNRKPIVMHPTLHDNRKPVVGGGWTKSLYIYSCVSTPLLHGGLKRGLASPRASTPALQLICFVHPIGMTS